MSDQIKTEINDGTGTRSFKLAISTTVKDKMFLAFNITSWVSVLRAGAHYSPVNKMLFFVVTEHIFKEFSTNSAPLLVEHSLLHVPYSHGSFPRICCYLDQN